MFTLILRKLIIFRLIKHLPKKILSYTLKSVTRHIFELSYAYTACVTVVYFCLRSTVFRVLADQIRETDLEVITTVSEHYCSLKFTTGTSEYYSR